MSNRKVEAALREGWVATLERSNETLTQQRDILLTALRNLEEAGILDGRPTDSTRCASARRGGKDAIARVAASGGR